MTAVKVSPDGAIAVPKELIEEVGLTKSERAVAWVEDGRLVIATAELVRKAYAEKLKRLWDGRSLDEWLKEIDSALERMRHEDAPNRL